MKFKELLEAAKSELQDLSTVKNPDFRLEQAVYKKDADTWEVVVSYLVENTTPSLIPASSVASSFQYHRIYKQMEIDRDKTILGMYIYENQ